MINIQEQNGLVESQDNASSQKGCESNAQTILMVEDDENVLDMGRRMLSMLGYQVMAVNDPERALEMAREHPHQIHLLITDVVMPEMSGSELAEEIAGIRPDIKTLFMSGYTADVIAAQGILGAGANFMEKPFSMSGLERKVKDILDSEKAS